MTKAAQACARMMRSRSGPPTAKQRKTLLVVLMLAISVADELAGKD
jgi:hypothetical protein